jgi:DNA polymerase
MRAIRLDNPTDFDGFLAAVAELLRCEVAPQEVVFLSTGQCDLFEPGNTASPAPGSGQQPHLSPDFVRLVRVAGRHSHVDRFALLYRLAWRLQRDPHLLQNAADSDVRAVARLEQGVRRAAHKMKAFIRFRPVTDAAEAAYVAWFEPEHRIVDAVAPFFVRRFTGMRWSILSPVGCAHWNGTSLQYTAGIGPGEIGSDDPIEALWLTYYANIFNPARLKTAAMIAEMPKFYWRNLPEARLIDGLIRKARSAPAEPGPDSPAPADSQP